MARNPPTSPLIAIVGATGTGKSQLAVELAKRYNGEIINGDAMQLYAGLPIITNKITDEEKEGIPHHLLGCIGLEEQTWVVGTFVKKALGTIQEIRDRGKLPILVGGTHYYTQSLLFKDRITEPKAEVESQDGEEKEFVDNFEDKWPVLREPSDRLLEELRKVDPIMADRWHPNDRRKIQRSLEIYLRTGRKASDIYAEQRQQKGENNAQSTDALEVPAMRFPTLLFWVHAETEALRERLNGRVDKMLDQGLLDEVRTLEAHAAGERKEGREVDETRGIWVSIGFKEFKKYFHALQDDSKTEKELAKLQAEAIEMTKAATRQYAKRQLNWIRIKLINALAQANARNSLFLLDASDVSRYGTDVVEPAAEMTKDFLQGGILPEPASLSSAAAEMLKPKRQDYSAAPEKWTKQHCEMCNVTCVTETQWEQHAKSKAHRKLVSKRRQQALKAHDGPIDTDQSAVGLG